MKSPDRNAWLLGGDSRCHNPPDPPQNPAWRIALLGAPGVGKGTQAEILCARLSACHLSTGDILRNAAGACVRSPALEEALTTMRRGDLVPDDVMMHIVGERGRCLRCCGGFILDGYPRTLAQAVALDAQLAMEGVALDAVFNYELPDEEVVERLGGRVVCPKCKAVYHTSRKAPQQAGVCDRCGGALVQRDDDKAESIVNRLRVYNETSRPIIDWYIGKGLLINVPAHGTPEEIYARTWTCGRVGVPDPEGGAA